MEIQAGDRFRFGEYELDCAKRSLTRSGEPLTLQAKSFDLLRELVENRGRVLTKDELLEKVWPGQFVEENNLSVQVSALRKTFGDKNGKSKFIATVPGQGYSFVADVLPLNGDQEVRIENTSFSRIVVEEFLPTNGVAEPLMLTAKRREPFRRLLGILGVIVVLGLVGVGVFFVQQRFEANSEAFRDVTSNRLTNVGTVANAALSHDGKFFVYSSGIPRSLRLGQTTGGDELELIPPSAVTYQSLAFSPDGDAIYYVVTGKDHPKGSLYKIGKLGGVAEKLRENIRTHVAFSPDMKRIAFVGKSGSSDGSSLYIAETTGTEKRELVIRPSQFQFETNTVAWSRDGKTIAVAAISDKGKGFNSEVFLVDVEDGQIRQLTEQKFRGITGLAWLADGTGLTMVAVKQTQVYAQIWHVSTSDGSVRRVNASLSHYGSPLDVSSDNNSMLAVTSDAITNIWTAPADAPGQAKQITTTALGGALGRVGLVWLADGRLVMSGHDKSGGNPLWIVDSDGKNLKQLTPDGSIDKNPSATADGRYVVFDSSRSGALEIWRIDLADNDLKQLTFSGNNHQASVSPDGKWVVYISEIDGTNRIWRVPLAGGTPEQIASVDGGWIRVSPDSQFIACACEVDGTTKLAVLPIDGGDPVRSFDLAAGANLRYSTRWTPNGKFITYRDWEYGYWRQSVDGGEPQRMEGFPKEKLFSYDWSPDGRHVAFGRGPEIRDVILVRSSN